MGELFGILVIAVSSLVLFALSTLQVAHRIADARIVPFLRAFVLPELEDLPLSVVAGFASAIAVCSQIPVVYLLGLNAGHLSAPSLVLLALEVAAAMAWMAGLAGLRYTARDLMRRDPRRRRLAA